MHHVYLTLHALQRSCEFQGGAVMEMAMDSVVQGHHVFRDISAAQEKPIMQLTDTLSWLSSKDLLLEPLKQESHGSKNGKDYRISRVISRTFSQ